MDYTFLGVQAVIRTYLNDGFRRRLHEVLAESPAEQSVADKRIFYKRYTGLLLEALPHFEMGFWDYVPRPQEAEQEFDKWCSEIEGSIATEKEEVGTEIDEVSRLDSRKEFIITTMLFLLQRGGNADAMIAERADIPEEQCNTRTTYGHLISSIPMMSFASVRADAVYLVPGSDEDGISLDELQSGGWEYLTLLS